VEEATKETCKGKAVALQTHYRPRGFEEDEAPRF